MSPESAPNQAWQHVSPQPVVPGSQPEPAASPALPESSDKDYVTAVLISFFLGGLGVDRFYLGRVGTGILKLVTLGGAGVWSAIDFLRIAFGSLKDKHGLPLKGYSAYHNGVKIFAWVYICFICLCLCGIIPLLLIFSAVPSLQQHARDTNDQSGVATVAASLDAYRTEHSTYPTADQFSTSNIGVTPEFGDVKFGESYRPTPASCNAADIPCTGFTLSYTDPSSHKVYTVSN